MQHKALAAAVLWVTFVCTANAQSAQSKISGTIVDVAHAPIPRSQAFLHKRSDLVVLPLSVNDKGHFETTLPDGYYDLFVSSAGFRPYAKSIKVVAGRSTLIVVTLLPDTEHLEQ